jgi:hypothetical protein
LAEDEKGVAIAPGDGLTCYNAACTYASIFEAAGRETKSSRAERERYASRAVELFRQAKTAGFFHRRGAVTSLTNDPDINPLREREDFKALLRELQSVGVAPGSAPSSK